MKLPSALVLFPSNPPGPVHQGLDQLGHASAGWFIAQSAIGKFVWGLHHQNLGLIEHQKIDGIGDLVQVKLRPGRPNQRW